MDWWIWLLIILGVLLLVGIIVVGGRAAREKQLEGKRVEATELRREAEQQSESAEQRERMAAEEADRARREREAAEERARRADEIDPDLKTQCATLKDLGITHIEFRSAWDTNVLDLTDDQLDEAAAILTAHELSVSSIGSPLGKINIEDDFDAHLVRVLRG